MRHHLGHFALTGAAPQVPSDPVAAKTIPPAQRE